MNGIIFEVTIAILFLAFPSCAPHASYTNVDKEKAIINVSKKDNGPSEKNGSKRSEQKDSATKGKWIEACKKSLEFLSEEQIFRKYQDDESYAANRVSLNWSPEKKEQILKVAIHLMVDRGVWKVEEWKNAGDSEKLPVNIIIGPGEDKHLGFMFKDREIETSIDLENQGKLQKNIIKTWTGTKNGLDGALTKEKCVSLGKFLLTSWGQFNESDVVVLTVDTNTGSFLCFEQDWEWTPWWSPADLPVYAIIMWKKQDSGEWKSAVRSKNAHLLNLDEICQALGEEWGVPTVIRAP